jgi:DNA primase
VGTWVDFKELKERVPIRDVLEHYGLLDGLKENGEQLTGCCPVHKGTNDRQFSVSTAKNAFRCFSGHCGAKGNALDLVAALEGGLSARDAGLRIMEWFPERFAGSAEGGGKQAGNTARVSGKTEVRKPDPVEVEVSTEKPVNPPLTFELQLEPEHEYLTGRGLTPETVQHFSLGFCNRGSMKGRVAIPIHNASGELVAYAGRWVGPDKEIPEGEGKYKLPAGFHKSRVVYNLHRVPEGTKEVVLVEGFFSVHWLHQNGWPNTVSVMGSSLSAEQLELLTTRFKGVRLLLDGDNAGVEASKAIALQLASRVWVRICSCPEGLQPDRLPAHELAALLK